MKIKIKLTLVFLLLTLLPLIIISVSSYQFARNILEQQILRQLESVASLQHSRVIDIINQNMERLTAVTSRTQLRVMIAKLVTEKREPSAEELRFMNRALTDARNSVGDFRSISYLLLDGKVVASTDEAKIGSSHYAAEILEEGKRENIAHLLYLENNQGLRWLLAGPLMFEGNLIGVAIIEADANNLISLVKDYTGLGKTGETVLAQKNMAGDILFIAPLRYEPGAALKKTLSESNRDAPIAHALLKEKRLFLDAKDYRGQAVLAVTEYVEKPGWGMVVKINKNEAFATISKMRVVFGIIILLASAMTISFSVWFGRSLTKPIINLTQVATQAGKGDLTQKAPSSSQDEIGTLTQVFNQMTANLAQDIAKRQAAEEALTKAKKDLEVLNEKLLAQNEELKVLDKMKDSLLSAVSHELKTPVAKQRMQVDLLERFLQSRGLLEDCRKIMNTMEDSITRQECDIKDILDIFRLEKGSRKYELAPTRIDQVLQEALNNYRTTLESYGIEVKTALLPLTIVSDGKMLYHVFSNLINNAIKYRSDQRKPTLGVFFAEQPAKVVIRIVDNGIGINEEEKARVFERFYQASPSMPGTGLGLSIAQKIVHDLKGNIWLESAGKNQGTAAIVELPLVV